MITARYSHTCDGCVALAVVNLCARKPSPTRNSTRDEDTPVMECYCAGLRPQGSQRSSRRPASNWCSLRLNRTAQQNGKHTDEREMQRSFQNYSPYSYERKHVMLGLGFNGVS